MSKMSNPFVSVIIPVYNDPVRLKTCLHVLEEQTYPKNRYEVLVVDNGSAESIEPIVAEFKQTRASFEVRPGSFIARNTGITLARGEVLAFTDADCLPDPDWIERGIKRLLNTPNCGIVGGRVDLFFKNLDHPTAVELYDWVTYLDQKSHIEKQNFSATANLFTFKHVFEHVGLFAGNRNSLDDSDDKEWGQQVAASGYALIYADDVRVAHPARYSFTQLLAKERRVARGTAAVKVWKKNLPPLTWSYESIMDHLPFLPPVIKAIRLRKVTLTKKMLVIGLGCIVSYIQIEASLRAKLREIKGAF